MHDHLSLHAPLTETILSPEEEKRLVKKYHGSIKADQARWHAEEAWTNQHNEAHSPDEEDGTIPIEVYTFYAASNLISVHNSLKRLPLANTLLQAGMSHEILWSIHDSDTSEDRVGLYEQFYSKEYEISLEEILENGTQLASGDPVRLYGAMLRQSFMPDDEVTEAKQWLSLLPVALNTPGELVLMARKAGFPKQISSFLTEVATNYQKAQQQVKRDIFRPDSPNFFEITRLYDTIATSATPMQAALFKSQILGINDSYQEVAPYEKVTELLRHSTDPDQITFYQRCLNEIEDSFEGPLGEELYDALGIVKSPDKQPEWQALSEAQRLKNQFLKTVKDTEGNVSLPDGQYGQLQLINPEISYHKNGTRTHVTLYATIRTDAAEYPLSFQIGKEGYQWSFLRSPREVPELFNYVVEAADRMLYTAITPAKLNTEPQYIPIDKPVPIRNQSIPDGAPGPNRKRKNQPTPDIPTVDVLRDTQDTLPNATHLGVDVTDKALKGLSPTEQQSLERLVEKGEKGLLDTELYKGRLSKDGEKLYRARIGEHRAIGTIDGGVFVVLRFLPRQEAFNRKNQLR